jgi:hypothetical protein
MAKQVTKARVRSSALVRAEHGGAPVHLTSTERRIFDEALRLGGDLAGEVESKVGAYGRWLLQSVFANDAAAALDEKTKNPVWLELVRRAGGPSLRISRRMLYVALQVAAYDKRIGDEAWRRLDSGRKELLLPLVDEHRLREAAAHVSTFKLTQTKTREYVGALMAKDGGAQQARLTGPALVSRMRKLRESLDGAAVLRRVRALRGDLEAPQRQEIAGEIEKLREVLRAIAREVRGR